MKIDRVGRKRTRRSRQRVKISRDSIEAINLLLAKVIRWLVHPFPKSISCRRLIRAFAYQLVKLTEETYISEEMHVVKELLGIHGYVSSSDH